MNWSNLPAKFVIKVCAFLLLTAAMCSNLKVLAAGGEVPGIEAKQTVYVLGLGTVVLSSLGLKWNSNKSSTMLLCCPPAWKVRIFNHGNKSFAMIDLNNFTGFYFKEVTACGGLSVNRLLLIKDKENLFKKLPAHLYKSSDSYKKSVEARFAQSTEFGWEPAYGEMVTLPMKKNPPPAQAIEALSRLYGLPPRTAESRQEFPLQLKVLTAWKRAADFLLTPSLKERLVNKNEYDAPANYEQKKTFNEVIHEKSSAFQELFQ